MQVTSFNINLTSEHPERLEAFYRDVIGLTPVPEEEGGGFRTAPGGALIYIADHSETRGPTKEPQRVLINFSVSDLKSEQQRLKDQGVPFIREEGREYWGGVFSTFLDPDGNYLQLLEFRPD
ncbi:MAG: hypothetical protein GEU80_02935 [Dehalococcoidia bacterium]|nr:hypothetical protein [Dehalococcoidia bacterium]